MSKVHSKWLHIASNVDSLQLSKMAQWQIPQRKTGIQFRDYISITRMDIV